MQLIKQWERKPIKTDKKQQRGPGCTMMRENLQIASIAIITSRGITIRVTLGVMHMSF